MKTCHYTMRHRTIPIARDSDLGRALRYAGMMGHPYVVLRILKAKLETVAEVNELDDAWEHAGPDGLVCEQYGRCRKWRLVLEVKP